MLGRIPGPSPEAFGLERNRYLYLIGGGGKTSLMSTLAGALDARGYSVLATTSTKMRRSEAADSGGLLVAPYDSALVERIRRELEHSRRVTAAPSFLEEEGKLRGFTEDQIDTLFDAHVADYVLVEADGAAGHSLKAHQDHEPVVSARAQLVVVVIGVDCIGMPINEGNVHRAALFCERLGRAQESVITVDDVTGIVFHADGYLKRIGPGSEVAVFLSKVDTPEAERSGRRLAGALREGDAAGRIGKIVMGDLKRAGSR